MSQFRPAPRKFDLAQALAAATETRALEIGPDLLPGTSALFQQQFGSRTALIVADTQTFAVAGKAVHQSFQACSHPVLQPFLFESPDFYASSAFVEELENALRKHAAIPVAVGAGTLNDVTKLAAHRTERSYMCVATAASMDGYTAFGASITHEGSKQTFGCPAPVAVLADLNVIKAAPLAMNASGYADLLAKVTAGADWILAQALEEEPIVPTAWAIAQGRLRELIDQPAGVASQEPEAIRRLVEGLMLGGFAMQAAKSSRPASGAEHQFSHLWDMQHHTHEGSVPSHGFKVGIGMLAVTALYEYLLEQPVDQLDISACCDGWPNAAQWDVQIAKRFEADELTRVAQLETRAKQVTPDALRAQLKRVRAHWPVLRRELRDQLLPFDDAKAKLAAAGAPTEPEQIGISRGRLRQGFWNAFHIRRRFTVLDLAARVGLLDQALDHIFGSRGRWPIADKSVALSG